MVDIAEVSRDESREKRKKRLTLRNLKGSEQSVSANCNCTGCPGKGISILTNLYTFERRTRGEFCRNDFLAVGLYTLDRVFAITLFYVCIALCVKTTTTRGQGHRILHSNRVLQRFFYRFIGEIFRKHSFFSSIEIFSS